MTEDSLIITIQKVDKDTETAEALLGFVKSFSWEEVKEHTVRVIKNWEFKGTRQIPHVSPHPKVHGIIPVSKHSIDQTDTGGTPVNNMTEAIHTVKSTLTREEWQRRISDCQSSGMSVKAWCEANNVKPC